MKKTSSLTVEAGAIGYVGKMLSKNVGNGKKILYVSDPTVDGLYGETVKAQIEGVGRLKTEYIENNTISFAMNMAERVIATDIECVVGVGGGRVLDVQVEHAVYGIISAKLSIASRYDADEFVRAASNSSVSQLSDLTGGVHTHTVAARDEETFQRITERLRELGILVE